jgi:hypothetical protein
MGFQPDWLWFKSTNNSNDHALMDVLRGVTKGLRSNSSASESTSSAGTDLVSFDADGFTTGTPSQFSSLGSNGFNIVTFGWKGGGSGVSNTDGTIASTVSVNTTSGFSIVTYTGTGANATVGHGLGVAPSMVIVKNRSAYDWSVWHTSLSANNVLTLNSTAAQFNPSTDHFQSTPVTSSVINLATNLSTNESGATFVAYCFAPVAGYSAFGSYTGNGSATGPSVTTDFEPTFLMIKRTDSTGDWIIHSAALDASNPRTAFLEPNTSDITGSGLDVDFNSTGFQIKSSSATVNANGGTYIYMCIA